MSVFNEFNALLKVLENCPFEEASDRIVSWVDSTGDFIELVREIGTIPEAIEHDSSAEKLFSKASDAVLARGLRIIGLKATVIKTRSDSADVIAESKYHNYTLVADAKAFRLSRTARNQKDYKVTALSGWRKDADYAVLCSPYFQYPSRRSQIYKQSIDDNVCLFSWEQLLILLEYNIVESIKIDLSEIWSWSKKYADIVTSSHAQDCFLIKQMYDFSNILNIDKKIIMLMMRKQITCIKERGRNEIAYWYSVIDDISHYSRKQAIEELIRARKINGKIEQISSFVEGLDI